MAQLVKNPPARWETWVWSLGWEDLLEEGKATHSSILAWRIPWTKSMGSQRVGHNWVTFTSLLYVYKKLGSYMRHFNHLILAPVTPWLDFCSSLLATPCFQTLWASPSPPHHSQTHFLSYTSIPTSRYNYPLICEPFHPPTHHPGTKSFIHLPIYPPTHLLYPCTHPMIHPPTYSPTDSCIHPPTYPPRHSSICFFYNFSRPISQCVHLASLRINWLLIGNTFLC